MEIPLQEDARRALLNANRVRAKLLAIHANLDISYKELNAQLHVPMALTLMEYQVYAELAIQPAALVLALHPNNVSLAQQATYYLKRLVSYNVLQQLSPTLLPDNANSVIQSVELVLVLPHFVFLVLSPLFS